MSSLSIALRTSCALLALALPAAAYAGEISGTVSDASETVALRAAEVRIVELNRTASTERDGSFRFTNVPAGTYTLEFTYIGAESVQRTVTVPAEGTVRSDVALAGRNANEILVIGQAANQASALSRKREADGVSDVLTRDAIGQFPDQNVAESLRRLPGTNILNDQGEGRFVSVRGLDPELIATSVNGVRLPAPETDIRSVALDVISSDIIESIEVKKSLTPDVDADTIGASVEIQTTSVFDRRKDLLTIRLEGSYNDFAEEVSPKASIDFATRLSDNFGVSGGISYDRRLFETDGVEADDWEEAGGTVSPGTVEYRDYNVDRERISASLGLDLRAGDSTKLYVRGLYSQFDDQEFRRRTVFDFGDFEDDGPSSVNGTSITFSDADQEFTVERDTRDRFETQKIRSIVIGGESDWGDWFADYSASWAKSTEVESGGVGPVVFARDFEGEGLTIGFDLSDERLPLFSAVADPAGDFADPSTYELDELELTGISDSEDEEFAAKFDIGRRFAAGAGEFTIQAGFKGRWREKNVNVDVEYFENDAFNLGQVVGEQSYRFTDISPIADGPGTSEFFFANRGDFELIEADSLFDSAIEDYTVEENVIAGYLLGRYDSSTLRVIGGLRYERTSNEIQGNVVTLFEEDATLPDGSTASDDIVVVAPIAFSRDYENWLPSLNIRYQPQRDLVLRLAGYRSLVRPRLSSLAPRFSVEQNDENEREGEFGNPDLLPFKAWNFDASAEYYLGNNGAITAAFFYKDVEDYIVNTVQEDGVFNGIAFDEAVIPINGESAQIYGFEVGVSQAFTFLPSPFDGFIVQANYTFTDAEGTVFVDGDVSEPRTIDLPATSRHTFNVALGYENGPFDVRLAGTYRDSFLDEIADEAELDRIVDDHFQLDLSAKFRVTKEIQLFYEWVNINNAKFFAFNRVGGQRNNLQFEEYNWTMKFGARINF